MQQFKIQNKITKFICSLLLFNTLVTGFLFIDSELFNKHSLLAQTRSARKAEADRLTQQGDEYLRAKKYTLATNSFEQALTIYREIQDSQSEQLVTQKLIFTYSSLGAIIRIRELLEECSACSTTDFFTGDKKVGTLQLLEGLNYLKVGDFNRAISYLAKSLIAFQNSGDREKEMSTLSLLGFAYIFLQQYSQGIDYIEQSLAISHEPNLPELKNSNLSRKNVAFLGEAYFQQGDNFKALEYFQKHLTLVKQEPKNKSLSSSLVNLGKVHLALGNYDRAMTYSQEALVENSARTYNEKDLFQEGTALTLLGEVLFKFGRLSEAEARLKQAMKAFESSRQLELSNSQDELAKLQLFQAQAFTSMTLQQVLLAQNKMEEALVASEWGRTRITIELLARKLSSNQSSQKAESNRTPQHFCQQYIQQFTQQLTQKIQSLPPEQAQALSQKIAQQIQESEQKCQESFQRLEGPAYPISLPSLRRSVVSVEPTSNPPQINKIRQIAQQEQITIVEYSIIYDQSFGKLQREEAKLLIWVIQPTGKVSFRQVNLTEQDISLAGLINNWRCFNNDACKVNNGEEVPILSTRSATPFNPKYVTQATDNSSNNQELQKLHQLLIEPIADLLPTNENAEVVFIPHEYLFFVPFAALQDSQGKYLIEKQTILTAPAIEFLDLASQKSQKLQQQNSTSKKALIIGNPTMPSLGDPPEQLTDLLDAEKEAQNIAKLLNTQPVLRNQATETSVVEKMSQANIIHFATHGVIDDIQGFGIPGAIALAPDGYDNGWLTSSEILDLKLNAELVVLSACNTGTGNISPDGVIGLSRSFISAGVPSIVVSLWKVPDEPTADLMTIFYENLNTEPNKAKALRQAMLIMMQQYKDPINWAAFTLIGKAE